MTLLRFDGVSDEKFDAEAKGSRAGIPVKVAPGQVAAPNVVDGADRVAHKSPRPRPSVAVRDGTSRRSIESSHKFIR